MSQRLKGTDSETTQNFANFEKIAQDKLGILCEHIVSGNCVPYPHFPNSLPPFFPFCLSPPLLSSRLQTFPPKRSCMHWLTGETAVHHYVHIVHNYVHCAHCAECTSAPLCAHCAECNIHCPAVTCSLGSIM